MLDRASPLRSAARARHPGLAFLVLCACTGSITTPELDPSESGGGGVISSSGGAGRSAGTGGSTSSGARGGGGGASGRSGAGGSTAPPDPGGGGERADAGTVTNEPPRVYCDAVTTVFMASCGNGSCHSNRGATIGDFAVGREEAESYVSRGSVRDPDCGLIIDPREPQDSLILTKVTGEYPSGPD